MKENGPKIECAVQVLITTMMGQSIKDNGKIINTMAWEYMNFPMVLSMKGNG